MTDFRKLILNQVAADKLSTENLDILGHQNRLEYSIHKALTTYTPTNTTMIVTGIKSYFNETSCIYCYLISRPQDGAVKHEYILFGPASRSKDGEYRRQLLPLEHFLSAYESVYDKAAAIVESEIAANISAGTLSFEINVLPSIDHEMKNKIAADIDNMRLPIKAYAACWLCDHQHARVGTIENHIDPAYMYAVLNHEYDGLYQVIVQKLGINAFNEFNTIFREYGGSNNHYGVVTGVKTRPLSNVELQDLGNISHLVWREQFFSKFFSNCVLNSVSCTFPVHFTWMFINGATADIFSNKSMYDRYEYSAAAGDIMRQLAAAKRSNLLPKDLKKIVESADHALRMSNIAFCSFIEHIGRTFRDALSVAGSKFPSQDIYTEMVIDTFNNEEYFRHNLFQLLYALHVMNYRLKAIHGDLHLNNANIFNFSKFTRDRRAKFQHAAGVCIYKLDGSIYKFNTIGINAGVIDYSRTLIFDREIIEKEIGGEAAADFITEQVSRLITYLNTMFPDIVSLTQGKITAEQLGERKTKLIELSLAHPDAILKVAAAGDIYFFLNNFISLISGKNDNIKKPFYTDWVPNQKIIKIVKKIIAMSRDHFVKYFAAVLDGQLEIPWPNLEIIKSVFKDNLSAETTDGFQYDIYNIDAELKYDVTSFAELKLTEGIEKNSNYDNPKYDLNKKYGSAEIIFGDLDIEYY